MGGPILNWEPVLVVAASQSDGDMCERIFGIRPPFPNMVTIDGSHLERNPVEDALWPPSNRGAPLSDYAFDPRYYSNGVNGNAA